MLASFPVQATIHFYNDESESESEEEQEETAPGPTILSARRQEAQEERAE